MLALLGGTGLYSLEGLQIESEESISTPFGMPSAPLLKGKWQNKTLLFLPRHGRHHELLPSEINYRANIYALKQQGATAILSVSASGSLDKKLAPGEMALVSQYIDFTKGKRIGTFFGEGMVAHISSASPSCPILTQHILKAATKIGITLHKDVTYGCVEGPRLGTKAESLFFKSSGCHLLGMTNIPEAFLALEAQLPYVTVAVITDYDCWLEDPNQHATAHEVLALYKNNLGKIHKLIKSLLSSPISLIESPSRKILQYAMVTPDDKLTGSQKLLLDLLRK